MSRGLLILILIFCAACTSDDVVRSNKTGFTNIYINIFFSFTNSSEKKISPSKIIYDQKWLASYKQPIIAISASERSNKVTLVALGDYKDTLTWVSADGISLSFFNGILIATRGYSQDLIESRNEYKNQIFKGYQKSYKKTFRYLGGENEYEDLIFTCTIKSRLNHVTKILNISLNTTKFTETCNSETKNHENYFFVLPGTNIVLKSKQWISPSQGSLLIYNYYAFQNDIIG